MFHVISSLVNTIPCKDISSFVYPFNHLLSSHYVQSSKGETMNNVDAVLPSTLYFGWECRHANYAIN